MEQENKKVAPAVSFDEFTPVSYEAWKEAAIAALKGAPFEKKVFSKTYENITLEPIYTGEHTKDLQHPGTYTGTADFLRGVKAEGYVGEPWIIAQAADSILAEEANSVIRQELAKGTTAVSFVLDEATLAGSEPAAGKGVSISHLDDVLALLDGIDLSQYPLHVYAGMSAIPLLSLIKARAEKTGDHIAAYQGCVGADPLGALAEKGSLPTSLTNLYDEMATSIKWTLDEMPNLKTILVRGEVYHNGGANAIQEVAACMNTAIAYIDAMTERGHNINTVAAKIRFSFSLGANFFMEIAKLRAARMVWAQIVQAYGGDSEAQKIDIYAHTSAFTKTVYDPYVNILRNTTEAFSGVVGGVSGMTVASFDEAIRHSDELSRRISRNTQIMLQTEFNLTQPVDPAGGSWYVEALTNQIAERIWGDMQAIEATGGMFNALQEGMVQTAIQTVLAGRYKKLATRADKAVGTNMYANMTEKLLADDTDIAAIDIKIKAAAAKAAAKADKTAEADAIAKFSECKCHVPKAFLAGASLLQVRTALNFGAEAEKVQAIEPHRWTEQFEELRNRTAASKGIKVFLANMGSLAQHKARADFSRGFFEVGGFEVGIGKNNGFATVNEAAAAAIASGADVMVICSTDDTYPDIVPELTKKIKKASDMLVVLAGLPADPELKATFSDAGIDHFIHIKANCYEILTEIQKARGIN